MFEIESTRRLRVLALLVVAVVGLLVFRLAWMQLLQGAQYKKIAEDNRLRRHYTQAPRGTIYDRNGAVLVSSRPSFAVSIIPAEYADPQTATPFLAELAGLSRGEIEALLAAAKAAPYTPVPVIRDAGPALLAKVEERKAALPGVVIEAVPVRHYVYGQLAAHVLGYVGRISAEEYAARKTAGYSPADLIGKDGLELVWEDTLRGTPGGREVEVNARGEEIGAAGEKAAIPGKGLVLTLDANLQKAAEEILAAQIAVSRGIGEPAKGGGVIALDVRSGAVLVLASSPAFDPNAFAAGISARDWAALLGNPDNPLTDRVTQNAYPPGSVFKIVTAAAALDRGLVTPAEIFEDKGVYTLGGWDFFGWNPKGLGKLNLEGAIAMSSDPVFYELGRRMGADTLAAYALTFGFGKPTGIGLPGEAGGFVPTEEWKTTTYSKPWYPGETIIAAIGQGYYLATLLQQAELLMAVANGGVIYRPVLVDKVLDTDGTPRQKLAPSVARTVYLAPETWETISRGLEGVVSRGTATTVFQGFKRTAAGKTGSAETGRGTTHSWFACYAPADKPEVVVAALIEDGGDGSVAAAPVARKVLEAYFGLPSAEVKTPPPGQTD
ncbi:penicillin-binding protein 2 [Anaeroselena agilis]|uniref:Penicillin-binding protein 2 n=1 Tax=Anaeroselena agilis TaxID=3063788 RepID=A0ABU3P1R6_9FIRM|nr:penicillin-binding protein 2 [Selenomonadales bacterium 4137-cl]